jgi:hypothetical protein
VVYRIRNDGTPPELIRSKYENGNMVFTASHISQFTIEQKLVSFTDRSATDSWMVPHIAFVASRGLFMGNTDGSFNPRGNITYGQLAAVLANYDGQEFPPGSFPAAHINWAEGKGIFKGVTYQANRSATRAHMAIMIYNYIQEADVFIDTYRSFNFNDLAAAGQAAETAIIALADAGIVSGDRGSGGPFRPSANITRAEVSAIIANFVMAFNF